MLKISKNDLVYAMSKDNAPVARVSSGSEVLFETCDCFTDQIQSADDFVKLDWSKINPATGPLFIEEACVGDILQVDIKSITPTSDQAVMVTAPNFGVAGDKLTDNNAFIVPLKDSKAILPGQVEVPFNLMIGVIGVAPIGEEIPCGVPDSHGGNMDTKVITQGASLFLPVNVPGALFALGDCHAAMGDGEVSICGLEIPTEVVVKLSVIKNNPLPTPMLTDQDYIYTIASSKTLDEAAKLATMNMANFIIARTNLTLSQAISILSIAGNLQISQVVDPLKTCRYSLPKNITEQLKINI